MSHVVAVSTFAALVAGSDPASGGRKDDETCARGGLPGAEEKGINRRKYPMNETFRKNMRGLMVARAIGCSLGLASIFIALVFVVPAQADVGPEPILPAGSSLKPEYKTPIEMQAEKVILNVREATEADNSVVAWDAAGYDFDVWFPAVAEVEANFTMWNPTNEKVSTTVWFPLALALEDDRWLNHPDAIVPAIQRFQIMVKGKPVDYRVSNLPNPKGDERPPLPWASFPVTFPAKEKTAIKVSYMLPAQRPEAKWKGLIMEFSYIFQTGAGWAGPIGKAVLEVNLPYPVSPQTIVKMPQGGIVDGGRVRWSWENFEPGPANDFSISLMQPVPWEHMKAAQVAVKGSPKDGQAWVRLCETYYGLSYSGWHKNPGFGEIFPPLGVEACQEAASLLSETTLSDGPAWLDLCAIYYRLNMDKPSDLSVAVQACQAAARLLPDDAAPHYGLAILYLAGLPNNASAEKLQPVLDELKIGQELEAAQPASPKANYFVPMFGMDLPPAEYITEWAKRIAPVPTATKEQATQTGEVKATLTPRPSPTRAPTRKPTLAPTRKSTLAPTPAPSAMSQPLPSPTALLSPKETPGNGQRSIMLTAAGVIVLLIGGYLALKRLR
jgi:hypothetical protein